MRLVLADDNDVTRRMLEAMLTRGGHEVVAVADGEAAVAAYERTRPPLVVLDWEMPVVDGLQACAQIRAVAAEEDVFILMLTGRAGSGDLCEALAAGVDDYLIKPATAEQLAARLIIAERRLAQNAARRAAERALADARWLAGVGETTLALQHEINNPLTVLLGEGQLLGMDPTLSPSSAKAVDAMLAAGRRIADVVRQIAELKEARSVTYVGEDRMLDLSADLPRTSA